MMDILVRAACFVAVIIIGAVLRRTGFFKKEDFALLSKIVIRITLPAAIITNFAGRQLDYSLLVLILIGFLCGVVQMLTAYLLNRRRGRPAQSFAVLNTSGVNIGNFVLPFAQGFLGPAGVMVVSLFDVGNAVTCLGGAFSVAGMIQENRKRFSFLPILRALTKSIPLITYIIVCLLSILRINLPGPVVSLAGIIGNANAFLAMLMLGVGFHVDTSRIPDMIRLLLPRYLVSIAMAALCYFLLPVPSVYRPALIIPFLGPVATAAPAFTAQLNGDYELASAINSFSILISILLITAALMV
jgi:predicted permease